MAGTAAPAAGYGADGVYRSPRPPVRIESNPGLSLTDLLLRRADACPSALALADAASGQTLTFAAFRSAVLTTAVALASRAGVRRGDVVLLLAPNCVLYPVCFFAVTALGAVATTANPLYTPREVAKQATDARAKLAITVSELLPKIADLRLPAILLDGDAASATASSVTLYSDLIAGAQEKEYRRPPIKQSDTAALLYSSGTTGASKGVILTHRNFISAAAMVIADQDEHGEGPNVFLCFLPMFHIFGLSVLTFAQLQRGNAIVVMSRFDMDSVMAAVERFRVTYLFCVPPVMIALAKIGRAGKYDLSSLKFIGSGAAPLGKDVMEVVARYFPGTVIAQGYGMTETCGIISLEYPEKGQARQFGSTGSLVSGVEAKIVDVETMKCMPPNQLGEICVRARPLPRPAEARAGGSPLRRFEQAGSGISGEPPTAALPPSDATSAMEVLAVDLPARRRAWRLASPRRSGGACGGWRARAAVLHRRARRSSPRGARGGGLLVVGGLRSSPAERRWRPDPDHRAAVLPLLPRRPPFSISVPGGGGGHGASPARG